MSESVTVSGTFDIAALRALVASGGIVAPGGIPREQVQPSSIDLRLAAEAYRLPGSILPLPGENVRELIQGLALERLDLTQPRCLAREGVYVVKLAESLALPAGVEAYCNGKSSTGRVDLATRVLADGSPRYDRVPAGYRGELWVELIPRSFAIIAEAGVALTQAIVFRDRNVLGQDELLAAHAAQPLLWRGGVAMAEADAAYDGRLVMTADLDRELVGFVAKRAHLPIVLTKLRAHAAGDFFEPVARPRSGFLFLEKDRFYILATREGIVVPLDLACEMVPFDATAGEFRAHYAGFFDPGWGIVDGRATGARAVLEVRAHADDLMLRHGQPICAMAYERLTAVCSEPYGTCGNTYHGQDGPRLSKHFK